MRRTVISTVVAMLLVAMSGMPAVADPVDKTDVIPLDYEFEAWNPCTEQVALNHFTGELQVQALPSIEAFYTDEWTHLTLKWVGQFVADDGYSTPWQHYATQVVNAPDVDESHVVVTETDNSIFTGDDGGMYKVSYRFHLTIVDGQPKAFTEVFDARCIRMPAS